MCVNWSVAVGTTVTLDGSKSSDGNLDPLDYSWSLQVPPGSAAQLDDPSAVRPSFVADLAGAYVASLMVDDGTATSDPPSNVTIMAVLTRAEVVETLTRAISAINALDPAAFKNPHQKKPLTNKINAILQDIDHGLYQAALDKLTNDVLAKIDGCAESGAPDKNDWIVLCAAQAMVYDLIALAIEQLRALL